MTIKCPKCHSDNSDTARFCSNCATPLPSSKEIPVSQTKTLEIPKEELTTGLTFAGRYQIIEELGKGGMGEVYRVKDKKLDEEIALKVLKPEIAADKGMIERFKNELKLARKIAHRSVCKMYDLNEEEETPYITMEYVKGENLKSFIRRKGKLTKGEAIAIAKQVCEGLAEAHELGVIHRDLKPQNIMVDEKGNAKVMDFGIARSVEAAGVTQTGVIIGTPDYISPEQAEGEKADQRSDIYALGLILYEMVTGAVPFKGDTALSVAIKHRTKIPPDPKKLNPEISENLSRLILICMEKDRERRYQSAKAILNDLRNIEEGLPLGTKFRPRQETFIATLVRKKLLLPTLAVAIAIITVIVWQFLPQKENAQKPQEKPSLAVVYFENNTGDESLDYWRKALSELLIADLSQSKYIKVLSGDRLFKILEDLNQLEVKSYSSDVLEKIADEEGIENILRGNFAKAGDVFRINVMLQNPSTGEIIGSEKEEGKGEESMFIMVDELTRRIKAHFQLSAGEIAEDIDEEVRKITTGSSEAYKHYSKGLQHYRKAAYRQCIEFMNKAIEIDPEFAMAYRTMAYAYGTLGYAAEQRKYLQRALESKDRISERERYLIQGDFYRHSEETASLAIDAYTRLLELYPEEWRGSINLGILYHDLEQWDKAIERFEVDWEDQAPTYFSSLYQAQSYAALGRYDKAKEVLEYYLNNFSDDATVRWYLARNYVCEGKYDLALVEADKASSLNPAWYYNLMLKGDIYHLKGNLEKSEQEYRKILEKEEKAAHMYGKLSLAALYLLQGRFKDLIKQLRQAYDLAKKLGEKSTEFSFLRYLASMYEKSGKPEEALKVIEEAGEIASETEDITQQKSYFYDKAVILLAKKKISESMMTAEELKKMILEGINQKEIRYYHYLIGMVEKERGNFSDAVKYLKKALSLVPSQYAVNNEHALFINGLASVYFKTGDLEKAQKEYEKIISLTLARLYYGDIFAKSFYMLGKIFQEKGWEGKAIEHYEKFLDLWKDADSGIAEVEDTKIRLARLKSQ